MRISWKPLLAGLLLLALLMPVSIAAASLEEDLSWLEALPGLSLADSHTTARHCRNDYMVDGDGDALFRSVRSGFLQRGWAITSGRRSAYGPAGATSFTATRGSRRLKVTLSQAGSLVTLRAEVSTGHEPDADGPPPDAPNQGETGTGNVIEVHAGEHLVVNDNSLNVTYRMAGNLLVVNGNENLIVVTGACGQLTVNGNNNRVDVRGSVRAITCNGNNNQVSWSRAHNPGRPAVQDNAGSNQIAPR